MLKKILLIIGIIFIIALLIPQEKKELRIRVIGASDSQFDQKIKMDVVNKLKKEIEKYDKNSIEEEIKNNMSKLDSVVNKTLKKYYVDPNYSIEITNEFFPPKELNGEVVPGGTYKTLLIKIDEAEGANWWSLLYPEYFNVSFEDISTGQAEVRFYLWDKIKEMFS